MQELNLFIDQNQAADLSIKAAQVFRPRTPISEREFFSGRWEQITTIADAVAQSGLHIVLFGERGVGKTSLANVIDSILYVMEQSQTQATPLDRLVVKVNTHKADDFSTVWNRVFTEITWVEEKPMLGIVPQQTHEQVTLQRAFDISSSPTIDDVRRTLKMLKRSVFIFDEFDRGSVDLRIQFTDLIKALSDYAIDSTIVLVGVSDTVDDLIDNHASIGRAIVQVQLQRMNERELGEILEKGAKALAIFFDKEAAAFILRISQGLPHYTHLIGLHSSREAFLRLSTTVTLKDVYKSFEKAVKQAEETIVKSYLKATHSNRKDTLYQQIILACAAASFSGKDALGYFRPSDIISPLSVVLKRPNVENATFQKHITEFCTPDRACILSRVGTSRSFKYRFNDPMLPPYIFMTAVSEGIIAPDDLTMLTKP